MVKECALGCEYYTGPHSTLEQNNSAAPAFGYFLFLEEPTWDALLLFILLKGALKTPSLSPSSSSFSFKLEQKCIKINLLFKMVGMEGLLSHAKTQELILVINLRPDCKIMVSCSNCLHHHHVKNYLVETVHYVFLSRPSQPHFLFLYLLSLFYGVLHLSHKDRERGDFVNSCLREMCPGLLIGRSVEAFICRTFYECCCCQSFREEHDQVRSPFFSFK